MKYYFIGLALLVTLLPSEATLGAAASRLEATAQWNMARETATIMRDLSTPVDGAAPRWCVLHIVPDSDSGSEFDGSWYVDADTGQIKQYPPSQRKPDLIRIKGRWILVEQISGAKLKRDVGNRYEWSRPVFHGITFRDWRRYSSTNRIAPTTFAFIRGGVILCQLHLKAKGKRKFTNIHLIPQSAIPFMQNAYADAVQHRELWHNGEITRQGIATLRQRTSSDNYITAAGAMRRLVMLRVATKADLVTYLHEQHMNGLSAAVALVYTMRNKIGIDRARRLLYKRIDAASSEQSLAAIAVGARLTVVESIDDPAARAFNQCIQKRLKEQQNTLGLRSLER